MTHPLTYEMIDGIHGDDPGFGNRYDEDDMRAAYDLAIEHVWEAWTEVFSKRGGTDLQFILRFSCKLQAMRQQQLEGNS